MLREAYRFLRVVGDEDDAGAAFNGADDALLQFVAQAGVQRGEGFVHQEQVGFGDERAGEGDALLHAAGEFVRVFARVFAVQPEVGEQLADARVAGIGRDQADVFVGAQPRQEARFLVEVGEAARAVFDAPFLRFGESGDGAQERGFAAAGGTGEGEAVSGGEVEVDVFEDGLAAEVDAQVFDMEHGSCHCLRVTSNRRRSGSSRPYSMLMMMVTMRTT